MIHSITNNLKEIEQALKTLEEKIDRNLKLTQEILKTLEEINKV